jgi:mono/diheme cytochrome c family protein
LRGNTIEVEPRSHSAGRRDAERNNQIMMTPRLGVSAAVHRRLAVIALSALVIAGCRQDMHDNPRYDPLEQSTFFRDGRSARQLPENTVARGQLRADEHLYAGKVNGQLATTFPMPVNAQLLLRGQERYNVFCSPCHGRTGAGDGMVVRRGYRAPTSFHDERLRQAPPGYIFDVITHGFGAMPDYATQVPVADRWAIAAYMKALQLSQNATVDDVPADRRGELDKQ